MRALDRKALRQILFLRGQLFAIGLLVACGVSSFVTLRSVHHSLVETQADYYEDHRFADVFARLGRAPRSLEGRIRSISGVARVETRVTAEVMLDVPGFTETVRGRIVSIPAIDRDTLNDLFIRRGRYLAGSVDDEVLLSESFADAHGLEPGDRVGILVGGRWKRLRVVGIALSPEYVYEIGGGELLPDAKRFGVLWMGRAPLAAAVDMEGAFNDVTLTLGPGASRAEVIDGLDRVLAPYGGLGAYGRDEQLSNRFVSDKIKGLEANARVTPMIFLAIAAFLLHLILGRLIQTERSQIAILKAFGHSNLSIGLHYLKTVLVVVVVAAAIGIAAGRWMGSGIMVLYEEYYHFPSLRYRLGVAEIGWGLAVSLAAGVGGALSAVARATRMPPAEAMRPEPPARYRPSLVESLGLAWLFGPSTRIIIRNIERKPVHTLLGALGIALAVALLILGRFFIDAIERIAEVQFENVQREDMTVVLAKPRSDRVLEDLAHLPGVLRVEPFRTVSVRLRFGHRTHRTGLTGFGADGRLRRLVDADLHPVGLPPGGVLMTRYLAEQMAVEAGDLLEIEVLEGARPTGSLRVAGLVDELMGVAVYMEIETLRRFLGEGAVCSGAFLQVDADATRDLNESLKRIPTVAGASDRNAARASFDRTLAESLGVFTFVLIFFACVITFAVVYNSARISLSERSLELGVLRVLGFTRGEIAYILLGEQAVVTLLAIPPGFAMGYAMSGVIATLYATENFRIPFVFNAPTYGFAAVVVAGAALFSALLVRRRLRHLDLVRVLKVRE